MTESDDGIANLREALMILYGLLTDGEDGVAKMPDAWVSKDAASDAIAEAKRKPG